MYFESFVRKRIDLVQRKQGQEDEELIGLRRLGVRAREKRKSLQEMEREEAHERMGRRMRRTITKTIIIFYRL